MTDHDAIRTRATRLRTALAPVLATLDRLADEGPAALKRADDWAGPLKATTSNPGSRGSDVSNPTLNAVVAGLPPEVTLAPQLRQIIADLNQHGERLTHFAREADRILAACRNGHTITDDQRREVADINRRDGMCPTCEHTWADGKHDDRLRTITVAEGEQRLMCDPCRVAWSRRPACEFGGLEDYDPFQKRRIERGRAVTQSALDERAGR